MQTKKGATRCAHFSRLQRGARPSFKAFTPAPCLERAATKHAVRLVLQQVVEQLADGPGDGAAEDHEDAHGPGKERADGQAVALADGLCG